jgi:microcystin degradation protein MlrC
VFGFPYAGVEEMGSAFITVTDNDPQPAQQQSDVLAEYLVQHRQEFAGEYLSVEDAVEQALSTPGPVGLLDMGDNVGGGAAGDGTTILHELHRCATAPAFATLYDPEAAPQAIAAGPSARVLLRMDGKTDDKHGSPLKTEVTVCGIYDGKFVERGLSAGGLHEYNLGPIVTVRTDSKITINLTQRRVAPLSIQHITCSGLDPKSFQIGAASLMSCTGTGAANLRPASRSAPQSRRCFASIVP